MPQQAGRVAPTWGQTLLANSIPDQSAMRLHLLQRLMYVGKAVPGRSEEALASKYSTV